MIDRNGQPLAPSLDTVTVRHLLKMAEDVAWAAQECPPDSPLVVLVDPIHLRLLCEAWLRGPMDADETAAHDRFDLAMRLEYLVGHLPSRRFTWPDGFTIDYRHEEQEVSHAQIDPPVDLRAPPE